MPNSERGLYRIEDDMSGDDWIADWAGTGIAEIEDLLAKHAEFLVRHPEETQAEIGHVAVEGSNADADQTRY